MIVPLNIIALPNELEQNFASYFSQHIYLNLNFCISIVQPIKGLTRPSTNSNLLDYNKICTKGIIFSNVLKLQQLQLNDNYRSCGFLIVY